MAWSEWCSGRPPLRPPSCSRSAARVVVFQRAEFLSALSFAIAISAAPSAFVPTMDGSSNTSTVSVAARVSTVTATAASSHQTQSTPPSSASLAQAARPTITQVNLQAVLTPIVQQAVQQALQTAQTPACQPVGPSSRPAGPSYRPPLSSCPSKAPTPVPEVSSEHLSRPSSPPFALRLPLRQRLTAPCWIALQARPSPCPSARPCIRPPRPWCPPSCHLSRPSSRPRARSPRLGPARFACRSTPAPGGLPSHLSWWTRSAKANISSSLSYCRTLYGTTKYFKR